MDIIRNLVKKVTLQDFAKDHGLTMVVNERDTEDPSFSHLKRFYVSFVDVHKYDGHGIGSLYGQGDTEEEAISNYAKLLSNERVMIGYFADKKKAKDIFVPYLRYEPNKKG